MFSFGYFLHLPRKMEPIEGSETSAFKSQTRGKYPKENILRYLQYFYSLFYFIIYFFLNIVVVVLCKYVSV